MKWSWNLRSRAKRSLRKYYTGVGLARAWSTDTTRRMEVFGIMVIPLVVAMRHKEEL